MKYLNTFLIVGILFFTACSNDDDDETVVIEQGDYPTKEYYLERDPNVNPWGAAMNYIHDECTLSETSLDYTYLTEDDTSCYDINFYIVKAYYYDSNNDLQSEGCPAMLLSPDTKGCKIGEGVDYFDSLSIVTEDMTSQLINDPDIDYSQCKDETTGFYDRETLYAAIDSCVIGRSFRTGVLVIPDGQTEQDVQPVFLIETIEGTYVKFMVKEYKPDQPNEKQTLVMWQIISE